MIGMVVGWLVGLGWLVGWTVCQNGLDKLDSSIFSFVMSYQVMKVRGIKYDWHESLLKDMNLNVKDMDLYT